MSQFAFLQAEWPEIHEAAAKAETLALTDARSSVFYARRTLELAVRWLYRHDESLRVPYQEHLSALMHEPTFRDGVGPKIFGKARVIKELGNLAVHSGKPVRPEDALAAVRELFHFGYWLARSYARGAKPAEGLEFKTELLPRGAPGAKQTLEQVQRLEAGLREREEKLSAALADRAALDAELQQLRAEVAAAKKANAARPDTHDYSEEETRDFFIDLLLKEAGWALDQARDREFEVSGMPNEKGRGFVDYVLWGDDGKPLAVVEAKRTKRDARVGQQQAKLYADCLERQFGRRPIVFYSNGYEHWLWDDASYPPRAVQGFLTKDELELLIQRRTTRSWLASATIDSAIVERPYQARAIRRIAQAFERDHDRKALVVMATGAGKTRTVIALSDLLMRCNWAKRVLFLADRVALVKQAVNAFKKHLPASAPVNLVTEKETDGRVYVSTYPTMLRLIDETRDGRRRFGPGYFDLVVIDEAHRSVYQKYRAIFEYFDSLLVGLTATPKDEVDRNTYGLFDLETGVPTDVYALEDAVREGWLVPPKAVSVPLKFQREGIRYDQLSDEEKEQWDELEWSEDGAVPDHVESQAVNKWLFNQDTVDKVLEHLMTRGLKVAGGDRLGKTIVFAKNHQHAVFLQERFDANYPHLKGQFARVIDFQVEYAQSLIDDFSNPAKSPHIAISVDMLDTGIDVPEVVNLVFFKLVRSKTKFWQMLGRGTRLRPDLFGPGRDKECFFVFDFCQNLEYFSQDVDAAEATSAEPLGKRLFNARVDLIAEIDARHAGVARDRVAESRTPALDPVRRDTAATLRAQVAGMNVNNFIVRPRRRWVEKFAADAAWSRLGDEERHELAQHVAGLPSEVTDDDEEAKRFDLLVLRLQLCLLRGDPGFERWRDRVRALAGLLEEKASIPMVRAELALIQEIQTDEYWQDVTVPMLESARRRLRALVKLIEKAKRLPVYTDFEDELGRESAIELPELAFADFERFRAKARQFLREHESHPAVRKLRSDEPLAPGDLAELERVFLAAGVGSAEELLRAKQETHGFGLFVRSLVGLDETAARRALGRFLTGRTVTADQHEFIDLVVEHLARHGYMDPGLLYDSPFTDVRPRGPEGLFSSQQIDELVAVLAEIQGRAA